MTSPKSPAPRRCSRPKRCSWWRHRRSSESRGRPEMCVRRGIASWTEPQHPPVEDRWSRLPWPPVQVGVLGPLRIVDGDGEEVALGAAKERSLLAALALTPGRIVTTDALMAALWGDEAPASARKTLQTYIKNVRAAIGPERIV